MIITMLFFLFTVEPIHDTSLDFPAGFFGPDKLSIAERRALYVDKDCILLPQKVEAIHNAVSINIRVEAETLTATLQPCLFKEAGVYQRQDIKFHEYKNIIKMGSIPTDCLPYYDSTLGNIDSIEEYQELASDVKYDYTKVPITKINLFLVNIEEALLILKLCKWLDLEWVGPDTLNDYYHYLQWLPPDPRMEYRVKYPLIRKLMIGWLLSKKVSEKDINRFMASLYDTSLGVDALLRIEKHKLDEKASSKYLYTANKIRWDIFWGATTNKIANTK